MDLCGGCVCRCDDVSADQLGCGTEPAVVDWQLEEQELHLKPFNRGFATEAGPGDLEEIGSLLRRETLLMGIGKCEKVKACCRESLMVFFPPLG